MNLSSQSVLTTVRSDVFSRGCYPSISGPRAVLVLSHQLVKLDALPLSDAASTHFPVLISKRFHNRERLPPKKMIFKWYLNRNSCSFSMLFLSYLCAFSICKWYHRNVCVLNWVPTTCRNSSLFFALLPHPDWSQILLCHSHFQECRWCCQRPRIMIFPYRTRWFSGQLFSEIYNPEWTWGGDFEARDRPEGSTAGSPCPGVKALPHCERGLGRAQHIVGT